MCSRGIYLNSVSWAPGRLFHHHWVLNMGPGMSRIHFMGILENHQIYWMCYWKFDTYGFTIWSHLVMSHYVLRFTNRRQRMSSEWHGFLSSTPQVQSHRELQPLWKRDYEGNSQLMSISLVIRTSAIIRSFDENIPRLWALSYFAQLSCRPRKISSRLIKQRHTYLPGAGNRALMNDDKQFLRGGWRT